MTLPAHEGYRERRFSAQDGLSLYYRDYGNPSASRVPLLCLPGLTRNSRDFAGIAERLADRRRVLCPDYRGRGRSAYDPDWQNYRPEVLLRDVQALLFATGLHQVVVLGTSLGGLLAMGLAVLAPTMVRGVILNDVGPVVEAGGSARILDLISTDRPQPDWPEAIAACKTMFPKLSLRDDAQWQRFAESTYRRGEDGQLHFDWDLALARPFRQNVDAERDLWPLFRALRHIPCLAIRGGESDVLSSPTLARMAEEKPDLTCVIVPGVGHAPSLDEPEVEKAVDEFFTRVERRHE